MRRTGWVVGLATVAVVGGVAWFRASADAETPRFTTAAVTRGSVVEMVQATGTLQPVDTIEVGTQVSGTIQTLNADFNSQVRKGAVIAVLDPAVLQSQVEQARATVLRLKADLDRSKVQVTDAQVKLARARSLSHAQLLPASDLDTAQSTYDAAGAAVKSAEAQLVQAQASLNQAQVNLSHTVITAPVDGIVLSRNVEVGQTVAAGLQAPTLFIIARDLSTMQVYASVDEADVGRVQPGQPVTFRVDAYGAETFSGRVQQIRLQPVVTQNVVSYTTVIDVPNADQKLKPGMTATVSIEAGRVDAALRVPAAALRLRPPQELVAQRSAQASGGARQSGRTRRSGDAADAASTNRGVVWVVSGDRLRPLAVQTLLTNGATAALADGSLKEGDQIVTAIVTSTTASGASASQPSASPLMPNFPRRGGQGGGGRRGN
jgi:HlyD family secretion protein